MPLRRFNQLYDDFFQENSTKPQDINKVLQDLNTLDSAILETPTNVPLENLCDPIKHVVVGQDEAMETMALAFKRPYFQDHPNAILTAMLVCGPKGSGKHTLIQAFANELYTKNYLSTKELSIIDLSQLENEQTLITDLYSSFQNPRSIIVFENVHLCHPSSLQILSNLLEHQCIALKNRYVQVNQKLQNIGSNLEHNVIKTLTPNQHALIFVSPLSLGQTKSKLGNEFLKHINDMVETKPLQTTDCLRLLKKDLTLLENSIYHHFQCRLHFSKEALTYLANSYTKQEGYDAIIQRVKQLHQSLAHQLMKEPRSELNIEVTNGQLVTLGQTLIKEDNHQALALQLQHQIEQLTGLQSVKNYIFKLKDMVLVKKMRETQGLKTADVSMHMIFTGNPGTGKTTMARLLASYLKALGVLRNGQLVEVTRADLVANYVGQTATKTRGIIEASLGGVLFIDEAYSLYRGKEDSFGLEAIDMLVKGMEDYRDDFIVVLAGYTKEMETFLDANSGLKSRFSNIIEFENYTGEELYDIALSIARDKQYIVDPTIKEDLIAYFTMMQETQAATSGNGRLARNIVEDAILSQASRISSHPDHPLEQLIREDFSVLQKK